MQLERKVANEFGSEPHKNKHHSTLKNEHVTFSKMYTKHKIKITSSNLRQILFFRKKYILTHPSNPSYPSYPSDHSVFSRLVLGWLGPFWEKPFGSRAAFTAPPGLGSDHHRRSHPRHQWHPPKSPRQHWRSPGDVCFLGGAVGKGTNQTYMGKIAVRVRSFSGMVWIDHLRYYLNCKKKNTRNLLRTADVQKSQTTTWDV